MKVLVFLVLLAAITINIVCISAASTTTTATRTAPLIRQKASRTLTSPEVDKEKKHTSSSSSGTITTTDTDSISTTINNNDGDLTTNKGGFLPNSVAKSIEQWPFWSAFGNSVAMILVTELGDKTFFIACVMAMRHPRLVVYAGAMGALAGMTILSSAIGFALPQLLPKIYTHYASVILFAFFGCKLLQEAHELYTQKDAKKNEELKEVEEQLGIKSADGEENNHVEDDDTEAGKKKIASHGNNNASSVTQATTTNTGAPSSINVLSQAFTLTFFAEWGDRSQVATIALASVHDPFGVTFGGILGHALCTGLAVLGGRMLATRISEKHVALSGGILFLVFALHSIYVGP